MRARRGSGGGAEPEQRRGRLCADAAAREHDFAEAFEPGHTVGEDFDEVGQAVDGARKG